VEARKKHRKRIMVKLTKRTVEAAEIRDRDYFAWDDEMPGFGLRVFASGKRSYLIQYRSAGRTLDLINDRLIQTSDKASRIGLGGFEGGLIVECDVGSTGFPYLSDKRGFARPTRSHDQDHWGIRKGLFCPPLEEPFKHAVSKSWLIGTISLGHLEVNAPLIGSKHTAI
jgi:hypothetical protein